MTVKITTNTVIILKPKHVNYFLSNTVYWAVTNLPCKSWARPREPRTVREIIGRPYLKNGLLLPHLLNALSVVAVPFAASSLWTVVIINGHRIQMLA